MEGVLDARAIDSVGMMGARLSDTQVAWIKSQGKEIILVPDHDDAGAKMIDVAIKHGFSVSLPWNGWWERDVKDCAEACRRYGSLWSCGASSKGG